jgi:Transposase DDE domain
MERHKRSIQDFTRKRKLTFQNTILVILRKSVRSLQCLLNETLETLPSAAAFTNARKKLKHTAFIELNQRAVVDTVYHDTYKTLHGLRLLAVDGSKIILPDTADTRSVFGTTRVKNLQYEGIYTCALASVLYDVLNGVALDAQLVPSGTSEGAVAWSHMHVVQKKDLITFDRGYCAYQTIDMVAQYKVDFLIRCHARSFKIVDTMLTGSGPDEVTMTIHAPAYTKQGSHREPQKAHHRVRFLRVTLPTGEYEILATSLLDATQYPHSIFRALYFTRWGIETLYSKVKNRLALEHFSGISSESIMQDFHATIFLTGLESLLTEETDLLLNKKQTQHPQQVNTAIAFHAIKHRAFDLFMSDVPTDTVVTELSELFLKTPTLVRKDKNPPRIGRSANRVLNFWKRVRRSVF